MKPSSKAAAVTAVKCAAGLSAGFILGPIVFMLANGIVVSEKLIAEKLVVGIVWFPILFFGLWVWGVLSKKSPLTGGAFDSEKAQTEAPVTPSKISNSDDSVASKKTNKWNYVGVATGVFMLLFLFLPQIISGTLANQYYLGVAFWIGIIIYSSLNILRGR